MMYLIPTKGRQPEVYVVVILKRLRARDVMPERYVVLHCAYRHPT